ncbi:MAG TPA: MFS transporter [Bryobacteraceae bacterium]|jgi:NNP family nitrate/nitrite transporter-like MFS transporter|nr:MFS transporter [Bryobacteraceae bacterium]
MSEKRVEASGIQLGLGTASFVVCFAAWGLISAFAPRFRDAFSLSATQTALLVAIPVVLGSLARIPMGMLTDLHGGRTVFSILMVASAIPAVWASAASSYGMLLAAAFCLGLAGSSFAVGVGFVSRWSPPEKQGTALGIFGLGNIGQSATVFLGPLVAAVFGWQNVFRGVAAILVVWAAVFFLFARNPPDAARPKGVAEMLHVLRHERLAWVLSAFYGLTFGGFVAFSIYLPALLRDQFHLSAADAGFRTAGFVVLATLIRPFGGWLSDRIGGARVLSAVFFGVVPFSLLLAWVSIIPFTAGALGCAALLGLGNGAVFKLVPQFFKKDTGTVTGLVGAMGGLGGFFPPLLLGLCSDFAGVVWPGFVLLSLTSFTLWRVNANVLLPSERAAAEEKPALPNRRATQLRAGVWASVWTALLIAAIVAGSRNLENFDPALVIYTFAVVFATWGIAYHYIVWLDKPPTRVFWQRGFQLARREGVWRGAVHLSALTARNIAAQTFIRQRSKLRWWMHQFLFWGCLLGAAVTFPLVFGWISFTSASTDQMTYIAHLFGFPVASFPVHSIIAELSFHSLDIAAFLVLAGIALALWRRLRDTGAQTLQSFAIDFFPLILLFAISVTGLALTVSQLWLRGSLYSFLAVLHAITVIAALLYLPFGKFFHIFQRPAQLGAKLYQRAGARDEGALCARCGERFASRMQIDDLNRTLPQLGFDYRMPGPAGHWQELCPPCKRKTISRAQLRIKKESHFG